MRKSKRPKGAGPFMSERPLGPQRRFRKTADELALAFVERLKEMGMEAEFEEVVQIVKGEAPRGAVTTIVEAWALDELRRGVEIVK